MYTDDIEEQLRQKFRRLEPFLDEKVRRLAAANEALALGFGGIAMVARASGLSVPTIRAGIAELEAPDTVVADRIRRPGAGRKTVVDQDPTVLEDLDKLIAPATRGDPECPLRWTSKSLAKIAAELQALGHRISPNTVAILLRAQGYSLQSPRKVNEGASDHPDRDAQFQWIHDQTVAFQAAGQPVISVDTKKKQLVGSFQNPGREWHPKETPPAVNVYDFPDLAEGKASPYGVYDVTTHEGFVTVGTSHDTAEFALMSVRQWWTLMGRDRYPEATALYLTADGGGSNGSRVRLFKAELQAFANETGLAIYVSHFPPGTSKWNAIEHELFSAISINWRGRPLETFETVVQCIAHTKTRRGGQVHAQLDARTYETGRKVDDETMNALNIERQTFHGEWNYVVKPQPQS
jgi:hypothetical protein